MSKSAFPLALLLLSPVWAAPTPPAPAAFRVAGAVVGPSDWTVARLGKDLALDVQTIHYTSKNGPHTARAVPLRDIIEAAQPRLNPRIKNHRLQFTVAVQGHDGYTVDFSLAELLPEFGHQPVWIAWDEDGKPLPDDSGPVELIVPQDVKSGRWVHGVVSVTVIDGAQPPNAGGA